MLVSYYLHVVQVSTLLLAPVPMAMHPWPDKASAFAHRTLTWQDCQQDNYQGVEKEDVGKADAHSNPAPVVVHRQAN